MDSQGSKPGRPDDTRMSREELEQFVARARKLNEERMRGYREQSLRIHPWVCARCGRQFTLKNLKELTVHHKDHNHDNNPPDGSNWEHLCVYCHDAEHGRFDEESGDCVELTEERPVTMTHSPFAALGDMMRKKDRK